MGGLIGRQGSVLELLPVMGRKSRQDVGAEGLEVPEVLAAQVELTLWGQAGSQLGMYMPMALTRDQAACLLWSMRGDGHWSVSGTQTIPFYSMFLDSRVQGRGARMEDVQLGYGI